MLQIQSSINDDAMKKLKQERIKEKQTPQPISQKPKIIIDRYSEFRQLAKFTGWLH